MDRVYLLRCLFLLAPSLALALPQTTATGSTPAFPTMSAQDGFGVPEGGAGSTSTNEATNGAAGSDNGSSWAIGTGGIVGIIVGIVIVIIGIGVMWWLWWQTKKYQMTKREALKRASRRMTGRKNPPRTPRLAPNTPGGPRSARRPGTYVKPARNQDIDLERGQKVKAGSKPSPGWLEDEKERSRSRSPASDQKSAIPSGLMGKLGFGKR